ncbi:hypothetical protein [Meridianimaribacter flavus]|uniref:Uncharacterized protein n=1 Tax=Meridianimaribacter flavus TaxID=571115 RepID=A0ABY2G999_9FLAO|nr:hypothetical protein [Meridianimaribacter flavus]TDY13833.1 hypothetical protein A8975_0429 [Meridianimaribacter flavus]
MEVEINNLNIDVDKVGYNDGLNFGRFIENKEVVNYTLKLSKNQFLTVIEADYNQIRDEIKVDDEAMNDTSEFSEVGYCSLEDLFTKNAAFSDIVKTYLGRLLLEKVVIPQENPKYIINSIGGAKVEGNALIIYGKAFVT